MTLTTAETAVPSEPTDVTSSDQPASSGTGRARILREALRLFSTHGYADVSMKEIADAAGMTKPALYYHFKDKEELFTRVFLQEFALFTDHLAEILEGAPSPREVLYRIALRMLEAGRGELRRLHSDMHTYVPAETRARLFAGARHPVSQLQPYLADFQARGVIRPDIDLDLIVPLFFSMISGQVRRFTMASLSGQTVAERSNEEIAVAITDFTLNGIVGKEIA